MKAKIHQCRICESTKEWTKLLAASASSLVQDEQDAAWLFGCAQLHLWDARYKSFFADGPCRVADYPLANEAQEQTKRWRDIVDDFEPDPEFIRRKRAVYPVKRRRKNRLPIGVVPVGKGANHGK